MVLIAMISKGPIFSEQQLLSLPRLGKAELVDGRLIVTPAGSEHGGIGMWLGARMLAHVSARELGWIFDSSTGFWMTEGNLRSPDVAFVRKD
jgi:Uma2 family endonuclease